MPKPGKAVKFPALFIHLCYNAYWESALTEPELLKHLPANIPFPHLTLTADLTYSANKHSTDLHQFLYPAAMILAGNPQRWCCWNLPVAITPA